MDVRNKLEAVLERIGLTREDIETRQAFLEWSAADAERLKRSFTQVDEAHSTFIARLYEHLEHFQTPRQTIDNAATLDRLKRSQLDYYRRLWQGPYDAGYLYDRLHIGIVHQRIGLDLEWYLGAYRLYLDAMLHVLLGSGEAVQVYASLLKQVVFDMTLAIDTYNAAHRQQIEDSEARYARAVRGATDGIWDWDLKTDRLYISLRWTEQVGLPWTQANESNAAWLARVHTEDRPGLQQALDAHLQGRTPSFSHEYRVLRRDGSVLWILARGVLEKGSDGRARMAGSMTDISRRKATEERLHHAARHDPLTGLGNRFRLDELLGSLQRHESRPGEPAAALMLVDLDRFKLINDSQGHSAGDRVLVEVAQRLSSCLRVNDHLIRFGGDEFVVLLVDLDTLDEAERVAQGMLDTLRAPMACGEHTLTITASIGIAPVVGDDQVDPLQAADLAMYRAKAAGKAQFARYSQTLQNAANERLGLESALRMALEKNEFTVHYQPIYQHTEQGYQLVATEALLRWRRDADTLVPPMTFVPILEELGEIVPVGEWVLREACRQTRAWQQAGQTALYCSVNLSSRQLEQPDFVDRVAAVLADTDLSPSSLVLEITESLLMEDRPNTQAMLWSLSALGVRLALDDFGTGYCSLSYLKRFPLHMLKVDKSFISGVPLDTEMTAISRAIIGLGASLGLDVVAEGVEAEAHLDFLTQERCRYAQGYWFSRPCPPNELQPLLDDSAGMSVRAVHTGLSSV